MIQQKRNLLENMATSLNNEIGLNESASTVHGHTSSTRSTEQPQASMTSTSQVPIQTVIHRTVPVQIHFVRDKRATSAMGIFQMANGVLSVILGLTFILLGVLGRCDFYGLSSFGIAGIIPGCFIIGSGVIAYCSGRHVTSSCLNGTNMAFHIISCVVAIGNIIIFFALLRNLQMDYGWEMLCRGQKNDGQGIATTLLIEYFIVFFVALTGSIYSCCFFQCCKDCCCPSQQDSVFHHQPLSCFSNDCFTGDHSTIHPPPYVTSRYEREAIPQNEPYARNDRGRLI